MLGVLRAVGAALLLVLKALGILLAALLLVVVAALFVPVSLSFRYHRGKFSASLRVLFFKLPLVPAPERSKRGRRRRKKSGEPRRPPAGEGHKKKKDAHVDPGLVAAMLRPAGRASAYIFKHIRLSELEGVFVLRGDPYDVGVNTGRAWQAAGGVMAFLAAVFGDVSYKRLDIVPDFMSSADDPSPTVGGAATARGITALCAGFILLRGYLKYRSKETEGIKNEREKAA